MKRRKGFTLIEIIIVIAIIGLLSSVMFAKLVDSKRRAAVASGQSFEVSVDHLLEDDRVGSWAFDETSGSVSIDNSGQGKNASLGGTFSWVNGVVGNAIYLDTDGSINIGSSQSYSNPDFTISFWVKPDSVASPVNGRWSNIMVSAGAYPTDGFRFGIENNGKITFWSTETAGTLSMTSSVPLSISRFNHILFTYSNNKAEMYLDGKKVASGTGTCTPITSLYFNANVGFGRANKMTYDNVRFYTASILDR